jgi:hypothetical protein
MEKDLINKSTKSHKPLKIMKIRYTRYPYTGFRGISPKLKLASFAGYPEYTATRDWENGLYIALNYNVDSHGIMFWKYPDFSLDVFKNPI